jgi:hypothetical protein
MEKLSPFSYGIRAVAIIATTVAAAVLGLMLSRPEYQSHAFFWRNTAATPERLALVVVPIASAALAGLVFAGVWALFAHCTAGVCSGISQLVAMARQGPYLPAPGAGSNPCISQHPHRGYARTPLGVAER